jgi:uncharacterized protein YdhG (YjbR/CyaY superfamily)
MVTFANVEAYIAAQPPQTQARLRELRAAVRGAVPDAQEVISYGMPTYRLPSGFVSFGAAQHHCALYGSALDSYPAELKAYSTAKGTVRFRLDQPIPEELVRKLVQAKFAAS